MKDLVGKECRYRKPFDRNHRTAKVVVLERITNGLGETTTVLCLDNGDKVSPEACYFSATARQPGELTKTKKLKKFMRKNGMSAKELLLLAMILAKKESIKALQQAITEDHQR